MPLIQPSAPPAPPGAPAVPQLTGVDVGTGNAISVAQPRTRAEVQALKAKRSELSNQLESATDRRENVAEELAEASPAARPGLEARLQTLDTRIVQLEQEIAANGRALANAPLELVPAEAAPAPEPRYGPFSSDQLTGITIVGTLFVAAPLAFAAARAMLIRARQPKLTPEMIEATRRMERMEQAIDAVAVEVERISEGQRFVTQIMAKSQQERIGAAKTEG